jgi:hypothetical protein
MQQTTNYSLKKPELIDTVADSIPAYADNLDDIDTLIKGLDDDKVDKEAGKGLSTNDYTTAEKNKLAGIAAQATKNDTDANLRNRATHTGTQSADTITDGTTNKVFTATEKTKLAGIATGATKNSTDATLLSRANHTGTQSADTITDGTTNKVFTAAEKTKLAGIENGANKYTHPATHPASMITGLPTSLPANGGNADTVGGFTVGVNVPANAKFTDTTYSEISTAEIDAGTSSTLRTITGRRIKYILDKVQAWLDNKVDKVSGKGLSSNDYTTDEKNKLAGIEAGAEVNNISDADASELTGGGETDLHKHAAIDVNITDTGGYYDSTDVEGVLQEVGSELVTHKADTMPHKFEDLKNTVTYKFGFQLSAEGNPQIIFEEVV